MKQLEVRRIDQTGDGVTVRYLPDNQVALTGPLVALERKIQLELARGTILAEPDELVETGYGRRIAAVVRLRPLEVAALPPWYQRPGLILTWVGSGCAVVLSVGAAVSWIVGAIAGLWPLLVGVAAVLVGGAVALRAVSGRGSSGTWKTN